MPDALQVPEGILLPFPHTVNYLYREVFFTTSRKMSPQFSVFLSYLLAVTLVSHMERVSAGPSVLFRAQLAGYQVHCEPALAGKMVAHPVSQPSISACEEYSS